MKFEWDNQKRQSNAQKHGVDFVDIPKLFAGYVLTMLDQRFDYGEERFVTLGLLRGRVVVVAHTERKNSIRIISARKATKYEEKIYFSQIPN
jgi:hypothetical protein